MTMLMLERGMDPPQMSSAPAAFFSTTSESLEPHTSFTPQPGDDVMDEADIEAATAVEEDEEADDDKEVMIWMIQTILMTDILVSLFLFSFLLIYAQFYI